jgi:O-antigen ligase
LLILTAGRTALAATALGMLVVLARKLKRNLVVFLAVSIIFGPVVLRAVVSFPGFEAVRGKLFSMRSSGRSALFADAWQKAKQKPIFGWGTQMSSLKSAVAMGGEYHNAWLQYAVDHGIPFGIFIMCVYLWLPFRGLLLMGKCQTEEMKNMANLSSAFLAACVFSNYLGGGLYVTTGILPAYSYIALQEGVRAEQRKITSYGVEYPEDHSLETWIDEKYLDEEILYR